MVDYFKKALNGKGKVFVSNSSNISSAFNYAMRSGETDCAVIVENNDMLKLGEKLSKSLGHIANIDTDVFWLTVFRMFLK